MSLVTPFTTRDGRNIQINLSGGPDLSEQDVKDLADAQVHLLDTCIQGGGGLISSITGAVVLPVGMKALFRAELLRYNVTITKFADRADEPGKVEFDIKRKRV